MVIWRSHTSTAILIVISVFGYHSRCFYCVDGVVRSSAWCSQRNAFFSLKKSYQSWLRKSFIYRKLMGLEREKGIKSEKRTVNFVSFLVCLVLFKFMCNLFLFSHLSTLSYYARREIEIFFSLECKENFSFSLSSYTTPLHNKHKIPGRWRKQYSFFFHL